MRPIVALMMSRDEEDIIEEVLRSWRRYDIPVLAIDDSSDRTFEILNSYDHVRAFRQRSFFPNDEKGAINWVLNPMLDVMRSTFGADCWALIGHADEIWYHSPRKIVAAMETEGAERLVARMCNHLLHPSDSVNFDASTGDWRPAVRDLPPALRTPWYTAHWLEERGFQDRPGYVLPRDGRLTPEAAQGPVFSRHPLIQHHSIRNPLQAVRRARDRVEREFQPAYAPYYDRKDLGDVFYSGFPALGIELERFNGSYGA
ncbi:MAG TPA: hypothetical protein VEU95_11600, partial [Micropepsaceae bacterium]|nr:hypothetical protein [Micropepsaceae bacterium]